MSCEEQLKMGRELALDNKWDEAFNVLSIDSKDSFISVRNYFHRDGLLIKSGCRANTITTKALRRCAAGTTRW